MFNCAIDPNPQPGTGYNSGDRNITGIDFWAANETQTTHSALTGLTVTSDPSVTFYSGSIVRGEPKELFIGFRKWVCFRF